MKKLFGLIILIPLLISQNLFSEEIKFETGSWDNIKQLAAKSNKIIFVDAYTDWCGWCKVLDKETFTNKDVIDFIGKNFIPVKYEMETGFGRILAMKYRVRSFPTQLFFTPDGKLVYTTAGYQPPKQFIETLEKVLDKKNHLSLKGISDNLEPGFPDFYKAAFAKNGSEEKKFPTPDEVVAFLDKRKDLTDEISWSVMSNFQSNEKYNNYFLTNYRKYEELYGNPSVNQKLYSLIYVKLDSAIKAKNENHLQDVLAMIDRYDTKNPQENKDFYTAMFYEKTANWNKFSQIIDEKVKSGKLSDNQINEYSWSIYENVTDPVILNKAANWLKPVVEKSPNYMNLDTYSALLYKTKNYPAAKKYAEKAIESGKSSGENIKPTEELLEKIMIEMDKDTNYK